MARRPTAETRTLDGLYTRRRRGNGGGAGAERRRGGLGRVLGTGPSTAPRSLRAPPALLRSPSALSPRSLCDTRTLARGGCEDTTSSATLAAVSGSRARPDRSPSATAKYICGKPLLPAGGAKPPRISKKQVWVAVGSPTGGKQILPADGPCSSRSFRRHQARRRDLLSRPAPSSSCRLMRAGCEKGVAAVPWHCCHDPAV